MTFNWPAFIEESKPVIEKLCNGEMTAGDIRLPLKCLLTTNCEQAGLAVCRAFNVAQEALRGDVARRDISRARMAYYMLATDLCPHATNEQIGRWVRKDRTAVGKGVIRARKLFQSDAEFASRYQAAWSGL